MSVTLARTLRIDGREVPLTHPDRVLWPRDGVTKADLVAYLVGVAPLMLPHLEDRPLVLTRYPNGIDRPSFYQKQAPEPLPDWIRTVAVDSAAAGRTIDYVLADGAATLAFLGNLAAIEIHPWMSRCRSLDLPDHFVIDLDPDPPSGFEESRQVAFWLRELLTELGLEGVPKLSGATGVHVVVHVQPRYPYAVVSRVVALLARVLATTFPDRVTDERRVAERRGRVYVDPYQNLRGKTVAAAYSPRPRDGAPVSMPVTWEELRDVRPHDFTLRTAGSWARDRRDPLIASASRPQDLDPVLARLKLHNLPTQGHTP